MVQSTMVTESLGMPELLTKVHVLSQVFLADGYPNEIIGVFTSKDLADEQAKRLGNLDGGSTAYEVTTHTIRNTLLTVKDFMELYDV